MEFLTEFKKLMSLAVETEEEDQAKQVEKPSGGLSSSEDEKKQDREAQPSALPEELEPPLHVSKVMKQKSTEQKFTTAICKAEDYGEKVLSGIFSLWKREMLCDVTLVVESEQIKCHRMVLATVSPYFQKKFDMESQNGATIEVRNVDVGIFRSILEFAYTGEIHLTDGNIQNLLVACKFFQIDSLLHLCENFASQIIAACNCFDVRCFAKKMSLTLLKENVVKFIEEQMDRLPENNDVCDNNIESVFEYFQTQDQTLKRKYLPLLERNRHLYLLRIVIRYISMKPALADDIPNLFQRINLIAIPTSSLTDAICQEPSLKNNALVNHMLDLVSIAKYTGDYTQETPVAWKFSDEEKQRWKYHYTNKVANKKDVLIQYPKIEDFNDLKLAEADTQLLSIELIFRPWDGSMVVGGITLRYNNDKAIFRGMRNLQPRCERHVLELEEGELITSVMVSAGWVVNRLQFFTNKDRSYGPYGGWGGDETTWKCSPGKYNHLAGFRSSIRQSKDLPAFFSFCAIWACYSEKESVTSQKQQ